MTFEPTTAQRGEIVIPFGVERCSPGAIQITRDGVGKARVEAPFPCLLIDPSVHGPLCISDTAAALFAATGRRADNEAPMVAIRDQLKALCDPWNRAAWQLVDDYLDAVDAALDAHGAEIEARSVAGDLYGHRDWIFAAPCPLPRAHILLAADAGTVAVDFAFWSGKELIAVDAGQSRLLPKAALRRRAQLQDAGVTLIDAPSAALTPNVPNLGALVAARLGDFWSDVPIPLGPFPSRELDALDALLVH